MSDDPVNHPAHYMQGRIEVIDVVEDAVADPMSYMHGAVIKYILRYRHKGNPLQDLLKARWYLDRMIQRLQTHEEKDG